jgi:Asp/Glu/hydantoin racemase
MRIKYIIPFPFDQAGIANRAAQIPTSLLGPNTSVECVPVRNHGGTGDGPYEMMLFDLYVTEAGIDAEEEGYDAVIMDSVSDSGLHALRSRLTIPVMGPGLVAFAVAFLLGKRFSIITMWNKWLHLYERNLDLYGIRDRCASIRSVEIPPDVERLFEGKEEEMFKRLTSEAEQAIEADGADAIILGSTTMHQAGDYMQAHLPCPVINPGPVAIKLTEAITQLGLSHSKIVFPSPTTLQDEKYHAMPVGDP